MILGYDFIEERLFAAIQKVGKTVTDPATKAALKKAKATKTSSFQQPSWFGEAIQEAKKRAVVDAGIFPKSFSAVSREIYRKTLKDFPGINKKIKKAPVKDIGIFSKPKHDPDVNLLMYENYIGADPVVTKTKKLIGPLY